MGAALGGMLLAEVAQIAATFDEPSPKDCPEPAPAFEISTTRLPGYKLVGLPAVEIYHTTRVNARYRLNHTDLCLPVVAAFWK